MTAAEPSARGRAPAVAVVAVALLVAAACGWLGLWQWDRAHTRGEEARDEPPVPIAALLAPASSSADALDRTVTVSGTWEGHSALVWGREIDGTDAVLLLRALHVPAEQTGTGEAATLAVLVGWRPSEDVTCPGEAADPVTVTITGWIRGSEPAAASPPVDVSCDASATSAISIADLAQTWPGPLYSAIVVAEPGRDGWEGLPPRPAPTRLNLQSLAYSLEWWALGVFAVVLAGRWVRDNGRARTEGDDDG